MMMRILIAVLFLGFVGWQAIQQHVQSASGFGSEKIGQFISKPFWTFSAFMSRPSTTKEIEIGANFRKKYNNDKLKNDPLQIYLNKLNDRMTQTQNPKKLEWSIHLIEGMFNAFALPGGVIVIGRELIESFQNEAQLVAIIAHERGHVDLGHCMTSYQKSFRLMYSKLQEEQADNYAFEFLIKLGYDPEALASAFEILKTAKEKQHRASSKKKSPKIIPELLESHPSLNLRIEQQKQKAKAWKQKNPNAVNKLGTIELGV